MRRPIIRTNSLRRRLRKLRGAMQPLLPPRFRDDPRPVMGSILSLDPLIAYIANSSPDPIQFLRPIEWHFGRKPALILFFPSWHVIGASADNLRELEAYRRRCPDHEVHFLCNAADEVEALKMLGEPAVLLNQNMTISEDLFKPLPDVPIAFSAVYNARFNTGKRLELAAEIDTVAYVGRWIDRDDPLAVAQLLAEIRKREPAHRVLNLKPDGTFRYWQAAQVNHAYATAAVGLCLSAVEGAMLASMEYLMAGLPIVSTPSIGGRDHFFDPDYCAVVPDDPRSIRDAVDAMKARAIPRGYIRERTLRRVERERASFLALLDDYLDRRGYRRRFAGDWPWRNRRSFYGWSPVVELVSMVRREPTARPSKHPARQNEYST